MVCSAAIFVYSGNTPAHGVSLVTARHLPDLSQDLFHSVNHRVRRLERDSMIAVFNDHLLAARRQSREIGLKLMNPDLLEGHGLSRGDRITRSEVFSRRQHDQGTVAEIAGRASGIVDLWIATADLRHDGPAACCSTDIGRTRLEG
jgi:hypothetical protein